MLYSPLAVLGAVTVSVVLPLVPGLSVREAVAKAAVQPLAAVACRVKGAAGQLVLSVSVTVTVYDTAAPGATYCVPDGDRATVGFAPAQDTAPKVTWTEAPVLSAASVLSVTPAWASV